MESRGPCYLMPRSKLCAAAATVLLLHAWIVATSETLQFSLVSQEGVEDRLRKYTGDNKQRETTLKQMFTDAGCDRQHISEQPDRSFPTSFACCQAVLTRSLLSEHTSIACPKVTASSTTGAVLPCCRPCTKQ